MRLEELIEDPCKLDGLLQNLIEKKTIVFRHTEKNLAPYQLNGFGRTCSFSQQEAKYLTLLLMFGYVRSDEMGKIVHGNKNSMEKVIRSINNIKSKLGGALPIYTRIGINKEPFYGGYYIGDITQHRIEDGERQYPGIGSINLITGVAQLNGRPHVILTPAHAHLAHTIIDWNGVKNTYLARLLPLSSRLEKCLAAIRVNISNLNKALGGPYFRLKKGIWSFHPDATPYSSPSSSPADASLRA